MNLCHLWLYRLLRVYKMVVKVKFKDNCVAYELFTPLLKVLMLCLKLYIQMEYQKVAPIQKIYFRMLNVLNGKGGQPTSNLVILKVKPLYFSTLIFPCPRILLCMQIFSAQFSIKSGKAGRNQPRQGSPAIEYALHFSRNPFAISLLRPNFVCNGQVAGPARPSR